MQTEERLLRDDIESLEGRATVRCFTNSLPGSTPLERATKSAQEEREASEKQQHEIRLRELFEDDNGRFVRATNHGLSPANLAK